MGHIINPISMRIGWFSEWTEVWYSEKFYYVEFFMGTLAIKFLMRYFYNNVFMEKEGVTYSHCKIKITINNANLFIFNYYGKIYSGIRRHFFINYKWFLGKRWYLRKTRQYRWWTRRFQRLFYRSFFVFFPLVRHNSKFNKFSMFALRTAFFLTKRVYFSDPYLSSYFAYRFIKPFTNSYFLQKTKALYYFTILRSTLKTWNKKSLYIKKKGSYLVSIFMNAIMEHHMLAGRKQISKLIGVTMQVNTIFNDIIVLHCAVRNLNVSAAFVARFIAKRLKQNYWVWELFSPIRRDFRLMNRKGFSFYARDMYSFGVKSDKKRLNFKRNLIFLVHLYIMFYYNFYLETSSFFSFDFLLFSINYYNLSNFIYKDSVIFFNYLCLNRWFYFSIFFNNELKSLFAKLNSLYIKYKNSFTKIFEFFIKFLIIQFYSNYTFAFFDYNFYQYNPKYLLTIGTFYHKFFRYLNVTYNFHKHNTAGAKSWEKKKIYHNRVKPFLGFKLQCLGRFTRRQRASKFICLVGRIPLNTLSAAIDYGYFDIALKNSAISVKVWIYGCDRNYFTFFL